MGNSSSLKLKDLEKLQEQTNFTSNEIKKIYRKFKKLDRINKGFVVFSDLTKIAKVSNISLVEKFSKNFTISKMDPEISFRSLILILDSFKQNEEVSKLKLLFKIYDSNDDGLIDENDLFNLMKLTVNEEEFGKHDLREIVKETMKEVDTENKGKIDFFDFQTIFK